MQAGRNPLSSDDGSPTSFSPRNSGIYDTVNRMALSARNQLRGQIVELKLGTIMAHVVVQIGENLIESVITRRSADEMDLKTGDNVTVVIKSTEVMVSKET